MLRELFRSNRMASQLTFGCAVVCFAQIVAYGFPLQSQEKKAADFSFAGVKYFHRFTTADQHEYTPNGQGDLKTWTDMITLLFYRSVKDGEALAATANAVLQNYKANNGMVVKTSSLPRTKDRAAEHLIVVIFGRPEFIEVAFARFRMRDGVGSAVVYSHRIYGSKVGDQMSAWLKQQGPSKEGQLMEWSAIPKPLPK